MANRIQIRRGSGAPSNSLNYELGWDTTNKILYINDGGTDKAAALPLTGGTMTGCITFSSSASGIIQKLSDTSNWGQAIMWQKATAYTTTYLPNIGFHNTGDTTGALILIPYATNTSPWNGTEGLYISKNTLKWENYAILTAKTAVTIAQGGTGATTAANARTNLAVPYMVTEQYPALLPTNGTNNWIKVGTANTSYGLLPSQGGSAGSGHNYLGTSTWYWKYGYIDEIYGHLNGNADTATSATSATKDGSGNTITSTYAKLASHNNLIASTNEFTFAASGQSGQVWFNYRTAGGLNGNIDSYYFGNGKGGNLAYITDGQFNGNATTATTATTAKGLWLGGIGGGASTHAIALKNWFDSNKASTPRNQLITFSDATGNNGSLTFGYFLSDYDSNPYGGFYSAHYNIPYYIGISSGTYTQWALIRDSGSTARRIFVTTSASVPSGAANGDIVLVKV